jgi:RIO-like serine/threonine protein kinase
MHERGLYHADLNLHNLLVSEHDESFSVIILDLDKARIFDGPVPAALRRRNAARILRSARKLDPNGRFLDESEIALLAGARPISK